MFSFSQYILWKQFLLLLYNVIIIMIFPPFFCYPMSRLFHALFMPKWFIYMYEGDKEKNL